MHHNYEKVLTITNDKGEMVALYRHNIQAQKHEVFKVEEMSLDDIQGLYHPEGIVQAENTHTSPPFADEREFDQEEKLKAYEESYV